jgi:hypothetical protein
VILTDVLGAALIVLSIANASVQFIRLRSRHVSVRQVVSAPKGMPVRTALPFVAFGVLLLISSPVGKWLLAGVMAAILAWEGSVWLTAWVGHAHHRRTSRA